MEAEGGVKKETSLSSVHHRVKGRTGPRTGNTLKFVSEGQRQTDSHKLKCKIWTVTEPGEMTSPMDSRTVREEEKRMEAELRVQMPAGRASALRTR